MTDFVWRDSPLFVATGGRLFENLLFRGIIDSLHSTNELKPPLRSGDTLVRRQTRARARWAVGERRERTLEARYWVVKELPKYWGSVFCYSHKKVISWLFDCWEHIDEHPHEASRIRRMVSMCIKETDSDG